MGRIDKQWVVDSREDAVMILGSGAVVAVVVLVVVSFTTIDGQVRFLLEDTATYLGGPTTAANLTFTKQQVARMNWASQNSLGTDPVADERLFCMSTRDGRVTEVRLVDDIETSKQGSVSGRCVDERVDADSTIHTHPGGADELSAEDKRLENALEYTCVQHDEIVRSPSGSVGGISCWKVSGTVHDPEFTSIEVSISG